MFVARGERRPRIREEHPVSSFIRAALNGIGPTLHGRLAWCSESSRANWLRDCLGTISCQRHCSGAPTHRSKRRCQRNRGGTTNRGKDDDPQRDDGGCGHTAQRSQEQIDKELDKSLEDSFPSSELPSHLAACKGLTKAGPAMALFWDPTDEDRARGC